MLHENNLSTNLFVAALYSGSKWAKIPYIHRNFSSQDGVINREYAFIQKLYTPNYRVDFFVKRSRERTSSHTPMERKQSALKILLHNQWDPATFVLEELLQKLYLDSITYCCTCCSEENIVTCLIFSWAF